MKAQASTSIASTGSIIHQPDDDGSRSRRGSSTCDSCGQSDVCSVCWIGQSDTDAADQRKMSRALEANRGQKIHDTSTARRSSQSLSLTA